MTTHPTITVFCGGISAEREVSLGSGAASALALSRIWPTRLRRIDEAALPSDADPAREVIFSTLHGSFGEDGGMQRLLDAAGFCYAGCDAAASALTMDKSATKAACAARGLSVAPEFRFSAKAKPTADELIEKLGGQIVVKPNDQGSSVGLILPTDRRSLAAGLEAIRSGDWLAERRLSGRELSVGVIEGRAMGVVEVRPKSGVYDYESKYTKGMTEYFAPAPIAEAETARVREAAEIAFAACGCRDYARVDFILDQGGEPFLLEINTLPGMKASSLLPMSARCMGYDFTELVRRLVSPALQRFQEATRG